MHSAVSSVPLEEKRHSGAPFAIKKAIIGYAADHAFLFPCQNEPFSSTLHKIPSPNFCTCCWFMKCNVLVREGKKSVFISSSPKPEFLRDGAKVCICRRMYNMEMTLKRQLGPLCTSLAYCEDASTWKNPSFDPYCSVSHAFQLFIPQFSTSPPSLLSPWLLNHCIRGDFPN